jgi:hypothetical protein
MKTAETKTPAATTAAKSTKPFFNKGEGSALSLKSENEQPFFGKNNNTDVQAKLNIGQPNDKYEQEADAVADKVVQQKIEPGTGQSQITAIPSIQAKCNISETTPSFAKASVGKEELQKKEEDKQPEEGISELQRKPESPAELPQPNGTSNSINTSIQLKCAACSEEENETVQKKEAPGKEEETMPLQAKPVLGEIAATPSGSIIPINNFLQAKCTECASHEAPEIQEKEMPEEEQVPVQTKLSIGQPGDPYEQEADAVADKVVQKLSEHDSIQTKPIAPVAPVANFVQAKCNNCETAPAFAKASADKDLQKKEEEQPEEETPEVQRKPIFESEATPDVQRRCRECDEGDRLFLKPVSMLQRATDTPNADGSRESVLAAARTMLGKIEAKNNAGGKRVGAEYLLEIFHLAAPGVWDDSIIETAGAALPSWCGIFTVWAHKKAGKNIGTWQMGKGVSAFGTLQQTTNPMPGDIGYIDQPFQHHCLVVKVEGGNVHSIDGNSGLFSEVKENIKPLSGYSGFFTAFGSSGSVQRKAENSIQKEGEASTANTASSSIESKLSSSKGSGAPLPDDVRTNMESSIGADFSNVNIHTGSSAVEMSKDLHAQAFTHGSDIYFNSGKFDTNSTSGQHLLAHELTHTVQQGAAVQKKEVPDVQKQGTANNTPTTPATARYIVEDNVVPSAEQLTKTAFLNRLNREVCTVTDAAFVGTPFTTESCPYITRAFARLRTQTPVQIETTLLRYDARLQNAINLRQFFEILTNRVSTAVTTWLQTGDLSGVPEEIVSQIPASVRTAISAMSTARSVVNTINSGISTIASGVSSVLSSIGSIFFKSKTGDSKPTQSPQNILQTLGEGSAMESGTRSKMEGAFGTSFSDVKVHTDTTSASISGDMNARAFTIGNHVAFGSSEYKPGSLAGDALLAHELAHVQQQKGNTANSIMEKSNNADDSLLEEQADNQAVNTVAQIWSKSNNQQIEIPKGKIPEIKTGLKLQRCGRDPGPQWGGDVNDLHIDLYTTTNLNEAAVDPGEAITRDFPSFVARLNYHDYTYPRVMAYHMWNESHVDPVGPRVPASSGVSRIPMPPLGQYTLEADVATGISSMPYINISRPIRIIESLNVLSGRQAPTDLANQAGRTVQGELLNYEQFSAIIRQNAVSVAGVSQELLDSWNTAQAQAIIIEASLNQTINAGLDTEAKRTLRGFYSQLRTTVTGSDVFHPETYDVYDRPGGATGADYTPAYTTNQYITAATNEANVNALNGGATATDWRNYLNKFYEVTTILNRYIADRLEAAGFSDSARQLRISGAYNNHLRLLYRDHPDAQPVQAVFYPRLQTNLRNDAAAGETPHYNLVALPQKMYTYRTGDGVWHLLDITRHDRAFNTQESGGTATIPPRSLITELDSAERFPEGIMRWQFQHGTADNCQMTHPWSASEVLNLVSMVLALAGMVALVAASGGALAPIVPTVLFITSGLAQAGSSAAHIHESSELGTLTEQSYTADVLGIASGLFSAAAAGAGHIVKAAQASEAAWTGFRGISALGAQAMYRPIQLASLGVDFGSLVVFADQAAEQYKAIAAMPEGDAKTMAQRRLVAMSLLTGGMTLISIRGGLHDVTSGRTLYLDRTTINGRRTIVAHRIMPDPDILAHPRMGSTVTDAETFLARRDMDETTFNQFRGELSAALGTAGMSDAEIRSFVQRMRAAGSAAEARIILAEFRNSRVSVAVGGVSRSAGYDLSYMHTSPQDFQTTVRTSFTQDGSIVHNGSLVHTEGADISNYTMRIDATGGARVEADVVVVYSDFTAGSAIGTGTIAPGAASGPARNTVVWNPATNRWTVRVEVDQRLAPRDIPRAVGHELDEAGDVINRLHGNQGPDVNDRIAALQRPGMFNGGGITSHDLASLREINNLLASAVTNPGSGNSLSVMLQDLGLTADRGQFQSRLITVLSSGQIDNSRMVLLEAWSTYDLAIARNSRVGRFTREQFIAEYENGRRFNEGDPRPRWYNIDSDRADVRQFFTDAEMADPNLAFNRLAGTGSTSSFRPYYEMLTSNGIVSEARVRTRLNQLLAGTRGRDLDFVRHSLKDTFRNDVMAYLTNRGRISANATYRGRPFEEASHAELLRITGDLNSSDKGTLAEQWYAAVYATDAMAHVQFTGTSGTTRYPDLLRPDGTLQDLKYIREKLSARELEQFSDYRLMVGQDVTITNADGSTRTIRVERLRYSFINPSGVEANAAWMHEILSGPSSNITFEIFNSHGQRRIINRGGVFEVGTGTGVGASSTRVAGIDFLTDSAQLNLWLNL